MEAATIICFCRYALATIFHKMFDLNMISSVAWRHFCYGLASFLLLLFGAIFIVIFVFIEMLKEGQLLDTDKRSL